MKKLKTKQSDVEGMVDRLGMVVYQKRIEKNYELSELAKIIKAPTIIVLAIENASVITTTSILKRLVDALDFTTKDLAFIFQPQK